MADGSLPIVVTPEAFGRDAFDLTVVEGLTVRAMLVEAVKAGLPIEALNRTEIYVDGARLDRETALDHVLAADQVVNVVVEPMGGGGGGRKDIGQILLTVAVIAVSAWVGGGAGGMITSKLLARAAAAITLGGQALIASLYAPDSKTTKANDRYALQSASNQYRQWGPMPLALGEVVTAPDLAAKTFTQSQGDDVWMYGVLGVHYGPCEVSEVKIGDTLVSTMGAGDFRMVQHLEPGPRTFQLYPNDVDQLDLNEELKATPSSATPLVRAASSDGSRFDLDFFLPAGLYFQKDDGRVLTAHASVAVRYRPIDQTGVATGPWQSGPSWARTSATKDPIRVTHSVHLPHGRYEFELTRNRPDDGNDKRRDTIMVSAIKSVAFRKPVADETLSIIEFAVRATAINQGGLAPITCRIKPKCSTWTGGAWGPPVATSNPAALARWLLTGPAPAKPLLPVQADARLRVWHQLCEQYDWKCHLYLTEARTQSEALAILERAGRAGVFWDGTQLAASPWVEKPIPAQVFTDDNLKDHRWEIVYPDPVHALRVEFQNIEKGGEPDELFVYNDGYGEVADPANGIKAASLIEALTLDGQATPNRAYRDGRWKLGQRRHQRRIDTWTADVEHLISHYGSRVRLAWNRAGGGSARVRCRRWSEDGSAVVGLRLSAPVEMFAGVSYAVDLRTKGGLYDGVPIQTQPGVTREILFASARHPNLCPTAGDLIAFGEVEKVSEDVEIIAIEPGENLTAVLTGVRYVAPLLMAGETGPIPPLTSKLSGDRQANPPRPTLLGVTADAHAVRVSFDMPTWRGAPLSGFSVRWRAKGEEGEAGSWAPLPVLDAAARELVAPPLREAPVEGVEATRVEIEITAATVDGRVSRPLEVTVVKPVPGAPLASVWSVESKGPDANGVSQPILIVRGEITDPNVSAVRIAWGLTVDGPWTEVYEGALLTKALEIGNLTPGVEHFVAITHLSAQGVPSQFLVIGPRVPGQLISGDTTHLQGYPVQDILDKLTNTATLADQNRRAVEALEEVYGDTASAAQSAAAAAASEAAANQAKAEVILAAAQTDQRAEDAEEARLEAQQARAGAVSARNESVTAAGEAEDSAAVAAQERQLATQARNESQAGAAAAVEARDDAASWASESGAGAAASQAAKLEAQAARDGAQSAAVATLPSRPAQVEFFTSTLVGRPENTGPVTGPGVSIETNAAEGDVLRTTGVARHVNAKGWVAIGEGRTHRVTARVRLVADGALPTKVQVGIRRTNAAADNNGGQYVTQTMSVAAGWQTITWEGSSASIRSGQPTATHFRPGSHLGSETGSSAASGGTVEIASLVYEDVTSEVAAKLEASASAASASSAAASDTEAGQKAAAAHEDMLAAKTARGGAQAAETGAVAARDGAEGYAATAAAASNLSSQYRDQSQAAAQASNDAAGIATTKADEAEVSAQAANAEKLAAQAARDTADQKAQASVLAAAQAEAFAGDAGDHAAASEGAAVQAAASAGEGLTYRNQAVDARDGAVAANVASGTSAQAALAAVRDSGVIPPFTSKSNIQRYWSHQFAGASETLADLLDANIENVAEGWALKINASTDFLRPKWALTPVAGQKVRVTVKCRKPSAAANSLQIITRGQSAAGAAIGANVTTSVALAGTNSQTVSAVMDMDTWVAQGAASVMFRFSSAAAGVIYVTAAQIEDVTAEQAAQAHAATALTQASSAGASAADARLQANLAAQVGGHGRRISDGSLFTASLGGSPASVADLTVGTVVQDASEGASRSYTEAVNIQTKAVYEIGSGRTFRVYSRARVMTNGADNTTFAHFRVLDASYANLGPVGSSFAQVAADGWKTFVHEMTSEQIKAAFPTAFYIRGAVRMNRAGTTTGSSGATTRVSELWMEDASELAPVAAQLAITAAVAADAADRVGSVRFDVTGGAGGDPFQIWGLAGPDGSMAGMVASELSFSTVVRGLVVKAMRLIGGDVFVINRLFVGPNKEIEIEPFTPAINWTMGGARLAIGKLANDNLLFWFGPNVTPANMRKSNAALWLDRAGGAYFGGALSAGTLTNKAATTSLSFGATTETARFNSHGGTITVTLSLSGGWNKGYWNSTSLPAATESSNVVVTLYRSVNGGAFSPVVTLPMTYNWSRETREFEPGLGWHVVEQGGYAGSLTYTDPQTNTQDRQYRATITTFSPITQTGIMTSQNLSIIAVE